jgi:hypothetical protein
VIAATADGHRLLAVPWPIRPNTTAQPTAIAPGSQPALPGTPAS